MSFKGLCFTVCLLVCSVCFSAEEKKEASPSSLIQAASVTVKSLRSEGSGTIISREVQLEKGDKETAVVNFVFTAGHVVDDLRKVRSVITEEGKDVKIIEFDDASVVKEYKQNGRRVGESKMDCRVIAYSDADYNEDLAILMIRQHSFQPVEVTTEFKTEGIVDVGTDLLHCGSLLGQMGANSMTKGIMSQQGRVYNNKVYDQTTVPAFPGSSGGGVYIEVEGSKPQYVGMITRGAGETFNLMVPMRRIVKWAKEMGFAWLFDPSIDVPTMEEINKLPVEKAKGGSVPTRAEVRDEKRFIFLDGEHAHECWWDQRYYLNPHVLPEPVDAFDIR